MARIVGYEPLGKKDDEVEVVSYEPLGEEKEDSPPEEGGFFRNLLSGGDRPPSQPSLSEREDPLSRPTEAEVEEFQAEVAPDRSALEKTIGGLETTLDAIPGIAKQTAGGAGQYLHEREDIQSPFQFDPQRPQTFGPAFAQLMTGNPQAVFGKRDLSPALEAVGITEEGSEALATEGREQTEEALRGAEEGLERNIAEIGTNVLRMAPSLTVGYITKKPNAALALMGTDIFSAEYGRRREEGYDPEEAFAHSAATTAFETLTEKIPLEFMVGRLGRGKDAITKIVGSAAAEGIQEPVNELLQVAYDHGVLDDPQVQNPDGTLDWGGLFDRLKHAGLIGAGAGGVMGAGVSAADLGVAGAKKAMGKEAPKSDLADEDVQRMARKAREVRERQGVVAGEEMEEVVQTAEEVGLGGENPAETFANAAKAGLVRPDASGMPRKRTDPEVVKQARRQIERLDPADLSEVSAYARAREQGMSHELAVTEMIRNDPAILGEALDVTEEGLKAVEEAPEEAEEAPEDRDRERELLDRVATQEGEVTPEEAQELEQKGLAKPFGDTIALLPKGRRRRQELAQAQESAQEAEPAPEDTQRLSEDESALAESLSAVERGEATEAPELVQQGLAQETDAGVRLLPAGKRRLRQLENRPGLTAAARETDTGATEAQREAGNYRKGRVRIGDMDVAIETPAGEKRRPEWPALTAHYGYIQRTEGADGDQLDVFMSPAAEDRQDRPVFVVDQVNPETGEFDEHKVMVGYRNATAAEEAYLDQYEDGWQGMGNITRFESMGEFREWMDSAPLDQAAAETTEEVTDEPEQPEQADQPEVPAETEEEAPEEEALREPSRETTERAEDQEPVLAEGITRHANMEEIRQAEAIADQARRQAENAPEPITRERRQDLAYREPIEGMKDWEKNLAIAEGRQQRIISQLTGLLNQVAFDEDLKPTDAVGAGDMDGLTWMNTYLGHEKADRLLKEVGRALRENETEDVVFYHRSGDEFAARAPDEATLREALENVQRDLDDVTLEITAPDGSQYTIEGIGFSFGLGETYEQADTRSEEAKSAKVRTGERAPKTKRPPQVRGPREGDSPEARRDAGPVQEPGRDDEGPEGPVDPTLRRQERETPEQAVPIEQSAPEARPGAYTQERVQNAVRRITRRMLGLPLINVVQNARDLPNDLYEALERAGEEAVDGTPGLFISDYRGPQVHLIADNIATDEDISRVIAHEVIGHHGLRGILGEAQYAEWMDQLAADMPQRVKRMIKRQGLDRMGLTQQQQRRAAADEIVAYTAEELIGGRTTLQNLKGKLRYWMERIMEAVRRWFGRISNQVPERVDDTTVFMLVARAHDYVQRGGPRRDANSMYWRRQGRAPVYHSTLAKLIEDKLPNYAPPAEYAKQIEARIGKEGLKEEEVYWSGVREFLTEPMWRDVASVMSDPSYLPEDLQREVEENPRGYSAATVAGRSLNEKWNEPVRRLPKDVLLEYMSQAGVQVRVQEGDEVKEDQLKGPYSGSVFNELTPTDMAVEEERPRAEEQVTNHDVLTLMGGSGYENDLEGFRKLNIEMAVERRGISEDEAAADFDAAFEHARESAVDYKIMDNLYNRRSAEDTTPMKGDFTWTSGVGVPFRFQLNGSAADGWNVKISETDGTVIREGHVDTNGLQRFMDTAIEEHLQESGLTLQQRWGRYTLPGGRDYESTLYVWDNAPESNQFEYPAHWETSNVLVHARHDSRTAADGTPIRFVDEIQSDWQQEKRKEKEGRDKISQALDEAAMRSYRRVQELVDQSIEFFENHQDANPAMIEDARFEAKKVPELVDKLERISASGESGRAAILQVAEAIRELRSAIVNLASDAIRVDPTAPVAESLEAFRARETTDGLNFIEAQEAALNAGYTESVPTPPMSGSYNLLPIKHLIRKAIDSGESAVVVAPGEVHADRWDAVANPMTPTYLEYVEREGGWRLVYEDGTSLNLQVFEGVKEEDRIPTSGLSDNEAAWMVANRESRAKVRTQMKEGSKKIQIDGPIPVNRMGLGLIKAYDDIIPKQMQKFVKKYKGKVRDVEVPVVGGEPVIGSGFEITDSMRETNQQVGFPLFMRKDRMTEALRSMGHKMGASKRSLRERWSKFKTDSKARMLQSIFDQFYGIKRAETELTDIPWEETGYMSARLSKAIDTVMTSTLESGFPIWDNEKMELAAPDFDSSLGGGFFDILDEIASEDLLDAWQKYIVARRAKRLKEEGREYLFTDEEIEAGLQLGEEYPVLEEVRKKYAAFSKKVLDFAEQAGVVNPESRAVWENEDYVPFYRVLEETVQGPFAGAGLANIPNVIRRLQGSQKNIGDPLENIVMNWTALVRAALNNHAAKLAVDNLIDTGIVTKAPSFDFKKALMPESELRKQIRNVGLDPDMMDQSSLDSFMEVMTAVRPEGENVINILRNGKREYYHVHDPLLLRAFTAIGKKPFGIWMQVFRTPKQFFTGAITLAPGFQFRNWFRDVWHNWVVGRVRGITPIVSGAAGFAKALSESPVMKHMTAGGATFESGYLNAHDPTAVGRRVRARMRNRGFRKTLLNTPLKFFEMYRKLTSAFENANRVPVYEKAIERGMPRKRALYEARDIMDFSMRGDNVVMRFIAESVPFFNARVQGMYRMARAVAGPEKANPMWVAGRSLVITAASLALWARNYQRECYNALAEDDKDLYYHFYFGGQDCKTAQHFRLPKPFEVGALLSTIPERVAEATISDEPDRGKTLAHRLAFVFGEMLNLNPTPQTVAPAMELAMNRNFFFDRDILRHWEEGRLPGSQLDKVYTSDTAEYLARHVFGNVPAPDWLQSPKQLDHLIHQYGGTLVSQYGMTVTDVISRRAMDYPAPPTKRLDQMPIVRSFYREWPPYRTKYLEKTYDLMNEADKVYYTIQQYRKPEATEWEEQRSDELESEYDRLLLFRDMVTQGGNQSLMKKISRINSDIREIHLDPKMTPDEKRKEVDKLLQERYELAKEAYELRPGGKFQNEVPGDLGMIDGMTDRKEIKDTLLKNGYPATWRLINSQPIIQPKGKAENLRKVIRDGEEGAS